MNELDRHEQLEKAFKFQARVAAVLVVIFYVMLSFAACFWWYGDPGKEIGRFGGGMAVVMLWLFTFNHLPSHGLRCINDPVTVLFRIPMSVMATAGYFIGLYFS